MYFNFNNNINLYMALFQRFAQRALQVICRSKLKNHAHIFTYNKLSLFLYYLFFTYQKNPCIQLLFAEILLAVECVSKAFIVKIIVYLLKIINLGLVLCFFRHIRTYSVFNTHTRTRTLCFCRCTESIAQTY